MQRCELGPFLLALALTGCSLGGSNYAVQSSAVRGEDARFDHSSMKFKTLYNFGYDQSDGVQPKSAVYSTSSCAQTCREDLYLTTAAGGVNNAGTIYDVYTDDLTAGDFDGMVAMSFSPSATGSDPTGSVIRVRTGNRGSFLTTASQGGAHGRGTVVALTGATLSFNGHNGSLPTSGLLAGPHQQHGYLLYTTTSGGGAHGLGAILAIRLSNNTITSKVLYSFGGKSDGAHPNSQLVGGTSFFGTTSGSKDVAATVYEFDARSSQLTTLYMFVNSADGAAPSGINGWYEGSTYGTTLEGGSAGYGTLYELTQTGSKYTKVTLHAFTGGRTDGAYPQGPPYAAAHGLYGVTEKGGSHDCGTIYRLDVDSGDYAVIYSFTCGKDGGHPEAPLAPGAEGLAGSTTVGGAYHGGTVFRFSP